MKKFLGIITLIVIVTCALCACGKETTSENSASYDKIEEVNLSLFTEVETSPKNLEIYREEVFNRLNSLEEGEDFIPEKEWNVITSEWEHSELLDKFSLGFTKFDTLYKETTEYYYPVVFRTGESLVLWYTDDSGSVLLENVYGHWNDSNYVGQLHFDSDEKLIASEIDYTLSYNQETGIVSMWKFNEVSETFTVPANSVYCGVSGFEGHIFRSGTDVYALQTARKDTVEEGWVSYWQVVCIAHNVQYVIDTDYRAASDPWSQPLFIMDDGTVKVYVRWEGDKDAAPDDASHLVPPYSEGGNGI